MHETYGHIEATESSAASLVLRDAMVGPFIARQAIGVLGHRIGVTSTPCRGFRFSIFADRAE